VRSALDLLAEPWQLAFMRRAFAVAVVTGLVCGVIGSYMVLRGLAFIGDAVAHAVFPGVAVAYVVNFDLVLGGAVAGIATTMIVAGVAQHRRLREDTVIGVFFAFAFGAGIVVVSTQTSYTGDLASFLFGQVLAVSDRDVVTAAVAGAALVLVALAQRKELVAVSLDRETAAASGLPTVRLDLALYTMITITVVLSLKTVGNVLVLGLLITPAATARLLTDRLGPMMAVAALIGAVGSVAGLYLSYFHDLAAGGLVVLVLTGAFLVAWLLAPRHGLLFGSRPAGTSRATGATM
jgi:manganese/iron transport system permease protein